MKVGHTGAPLSKIATSRKVTQVLQSTTAPVVSPPGLSHPITAVPSSSTRGLTNFQGLGSFNSGLATRVRPFWPRLSGKFWSEIPGSTTRKVGNIRSLSVSSEPPGYRDFQGKMPSAQHEIRPAELVTERLETPSLDDRTYRVIRLPNQLEALIVHDAQTDKASAAMDVNVGNFSDDADMPGMAHAVEHVSAIPCPDHLLTSVLTGTKLLFMGTRKYPEENAYNQYLSAHSGSSNAYTAATSTNYYFEVGSRPSDDQEPSSSNPSPLKGGLDRFAQFFVEPLFLESTLDRELRAVDSENKKNLQSDTWRLNQLEKSLSNPAHPYCYFSTGSLDTLKTKPEAREINVRQKFIEFYEKHYSANRMKLVVLGREPLDVLESWVVEYFSGVEDKNLKPNRWSEDAPLGPEQLASQVFAKPVMDSRELGLCFPFPDEDELFESLPSRYISHLIGHEGPGSIMSYIKGKGWANGLTAGAYPVCPGSPGMFDCQVRLTEEVSNPSATQFFATS